MASSDLTERQKIELEVKKQLLFSIRGMKACQITNCSGFGTTRCKRMLSPRYVYDNLPCDQAVSAYCTKFAVHDMDPMLKTLLAQLPVFCKYEDNGCKEVLMKPEMDKHESGCLYRPINCADLDCYLYPVYMNFMDHFYKIHKNCKFLSPNGNMRFNIRSKIAQVSTMPMKFSPTEISAFNQTFFEVGMIKNDFLFRWIYMLGDHNEAKNYFYNVRIKKGTSGNELTFSGQVRTMFENHVYITGSYLAFNMPKVRIEEFLDGNSNLVFEYTIRSLKQEAKEKVNDDDFESGISDEN